MTIGQSIRKCRKDKKLTQVQLAEAIGCKGTQVSSWEIGNVFPSICTCMSIADTLGVTLDELVGRRLENERAV